MTKLKVFAYILIVVAALISFKILKFSYYTPRWNAIFYTYANKGLSPHFEGPFMTEVECLKVGKELMSQKKIVLYGNLEPATFFCGKDCDNEAFDRDGAVFDMTCTEGHPPERPE